MILAIVSVINGKKLLALIPARGGSKRLPKKNILDLLGKPMISWSIEAALGSKFIDKVIVSTDDKEISDIAENYGVSAPFLRPAELSEDDTSSIDVALHALSEIEQSDIDYHYILLLQPTSPLRKSFHIDSAVNLFIEKSADAIVSVTEMEHPIEWVGEISDDLSMNNFITETKKNKRSQRKYFYCSWRWICRIFGRRR